SLLIYSDFTEFLSMALAESVIGHQVFLWAIEEKEVNTFPLKYLPQEWEFLLTGFAYLPPVSEDINRLGQVDQTCHHSN
ncbi:hypothetical protein ACQP3F_31575, partial [Escherichia coli]